MRPEGRATTFFESFYRAFAGFPDAERLALFDGFCAYVFDGKEPRNLSPFANAVWLVIRPFLDARRTKAEAGAKGGRASVEARNSKQSGKQTVKQTPSKAPSKAPSKPSSKIEANTQANGEAKHQANAQANAKQYEVEVEVEEEIEVEDKSSSSLRTEGREKTERELARDLIETLTPLFPNTKRRCTIETEQIVERRKLYLRKDEIVAIAKAWLATPDWTKEGYRYAVSLHNFLESNYCVAPPDATESSHASTEDRRAKRRAAISAAMANQNGNGGAK